MGATSELGGGRPILGHIRPILSMISGDNMATVSNTGDSIYKACTHTSVSECILLATAG